MWRWTLKVECTLFWIVLFINGTNILTQLHSPWLPLRPILKTQHNKFVNSSSWGRITSLGHHWFRSWLGGCSVPSHYLNQSCSVVNWTLGNKLQSNCSRNLNFSLKEMHLEMSSGKCRPCCLGLKATLITMQEWLLTEKVVLNRDTLIVIW